MLRGVDLAAHYEDKRGTYAAFGTGLVHDLAREVLAASPGGAVLDVGCASGGLLAALAPVARRRDGVELSRGAAEAARQHADDVVGTGLDRLEPGDLAGALYDLVVCADVLEHLVDPADGLRRAVALVRPGGAVLVSVPNVAHWSVRRQLAGGRFDYAPSGILDEGHLRFFTRRSLDALVRGAGLVEPRHEAVLPALRNHVPALDRAPARVRAAVEARWRALGERRAELLGFQLVCLARRPA